jgi:thioredoxin
VHAAQRPETQEQTMSAPINVTLSTFKKEVIESPIPVVVDFWAPWCGPCRTLGPMLETAAKKHAGAVKVVKINVDEETSLAGTFQVKGIPMLLYVRGGKVVDQQTGLPSRVDLDRKLSELAGPPA